MTLLIFLIASILDIVDGFLARKLKQVTHLGAALDGLGDKLMISSMVISFVIVKGIPLFWIILILFRDIVVGLAVITMKSFVRNKKKVTFMAKKSGKLVTFLQIVTLVSIIIDSDYTLYLLYATFFVSIWCVSEYKTAWQKKVSIKDIKI